ncbi:MAG: hypothetical protein ACTSQI_04770 [Candidatus Helarchaeota archaeon]
MKAKTNSYQTDRIRKKGILIVILIFIGLIVPFLLLAVTIKGPPMSFPTHHQIPIDDICGICHLGSDNASSQEWGDMKALGASWTRVDFHWSGIEPSNDVWNWDYWDAFMNASEQHNVKVLALLLYDNANVETVNPLNDKYIHPDDIPYFLDYVNHTVRRYKDRVAAWEIWNEPNIHFWNGPIEDFYKLFNQTITLIHQIEIEFSQDLTVLSSAMASSTAGFVFRDLERMFELGIMQHIDVVPFHFYSYEADSLYRGILQTKIVGEKFGFKGEYWITEIGNPTGGQYPWSVSQEQLARNVIKMHVISSNLQIKKLMWYHDRDALHLDPYNSEGWFGLLYGNGTWKPAAYAYQLFSLHCSNSILYQNLIVKTGGISAMDLMATLYRRVNGNSTLIMWYDPTLYIEGTIKVNLNLSELGDITIYDIYTGMNQTLVGNTVVVGKVPVFITFQAIHNSTPVTLYITESRLAIALYVIVFTILISSLGLAVVVKKRQGCS